MAKDYEYLGKVDLLYICQLISTELNKYVAKVNGKDLSTEDFTTALKTKLEGIDLSIYSTTTEMNKAISDAVAGITGISFDGPYADYATLVATVTNPKNGVIYLVRNSGSAPNATDEYFWNGTSFEKFGTTDIDLSGYVKKDDIAELSTTEVQAVWDSVFTS